MNKTRAGIVSDVVAGEKGDFEGVIVGPTATFLLLLPLDESPQGMAAQIIRQYLSINASEAFKTAGTNLRSPEDLGRKFIRENVSRVMRHPIAWRRTSYTIEAVRNYVGKRDRSVAWDRPRRSCPNDDVRARD